MCVKWLYINVVFKNIRRSIEQSNSLFKNCGWNSNFILAIYCYFQPIHFFEFLFYATQYAATYYLIRLLCRRWGKVANGMLHITRKWWFLQAENAKILNLRNVQVLEHLFLPKKHYIVCIWKYSIKSQLRAMSTFK